MLTVLISEFFALFAPSMLAIPVLKSSAPSTPFAIIISIFRSFALFALSATFVLFMFAMPVSKSSTLFIPFVTSYIHQLRKDKG